MNIANCPKCGGEHFGSFKCPFDSNREKRVMKVINPSLYRVRGKGSRMTVLCGPITPTNVEAMLDAGGIEVEVDGEKWWKVRRNGQTKRWKTRPGEFRIPIKAGLWFYGAITHKDFVEASTYEIDKYIDEGGVTVTLSTDGMGWDVDRWKSDINEWHLTCDRFEEAVNTFEQWRPLSKSQRLR